MAIWFDNYKIEHIRNFENGNMLAHLGIEFTHIAADYLVGRMPVDERTRQPIGMLHGGASVVLAESLGSIASNLVVDPTHYYCVGQEINANHIRPVTHGFVFGKALPIHLGKRTHVWSIEITNDQGKMVCISRITMAVLNR